MLRHGELFFAAPHELNDAHECRARFVFKGSLDLWERLTEFLLVELYLSVETLHNYFRNDFEHLPALSKKIAFIIHKLTRKKDVELAELGMLLTEAIRKALDEGISVFGGPTVAVTISDFIKNKLPQHLNQSQYIASFSLNATNPTMWGHYADAEKGFVIIYEAEKNEINVASPLKLFPGARKLNNSDILTLGHYNDIALPIKAVTYGNRPPKINAFQLLIPKFHYTEEEHHYDVPLNIGSDAPEKQAAILGLVKSKDWKYEREVRAYLCSSEALSPEQRSLTLPQDAAKGIIFGAKMSAYNKSRVVKSCGLLSGFRSETPIPSILFLEARQSGNSFKLQVDPIGVLNKKSPYGSPAFCPIDQAEESDVARLHYMSKVINGSGIS